MFVVCWSLRSLCHSNGHIETMPAREINPWPGFDPSFSGHNDRRAITASGHDYALDHSAIEAGHMHYVIYSYFYYNLLFIHTN